MVLQSGLVPSAGFPHHGHGHGYGHGLGHSHGQGQAYLHKEEHYKENSYKDGFGHKEDYYKKDYYSNNSSHSKPNSYGHSSHLGGHGGYSHHNYGGHGAYPQHGYGASHGTHVPVGPTKYEEKYEYHQQGHNSSRPYYEHKENHSWVSKDLDD